ncbi:hypothetical protein HFP51_12490 [Parasphingopyxis sp. CP4]|uniref:hypothetical protein n=1 Tax=Parasphingopyxis sp. CP4 TaxID=2724527 RepID=UPI0015A15959|nr:hypothetical protein [Parasphingopyxis sp. CP4]QLC22929.1 hypothetical protein HFP51_12490 [Parasphingopyxis sp. CP4]
MSAFRILLVALFLNILVYTAIVIGNHGANLAPDFLGDIVALAWPGQFNVDFTSFLILSALWVAWRHNFSPAGLALAVPALFGGMLFLAPYLLIASYAAKGDMRVLLLGSARAQAS